MQQQIQKLWKLIKKSKRILLINHIRMDGDAWGSLGGLALVLKSMKKDVKAINDTPVPDMLQFLWHNDLIEPDLDVKAFNPDLIIALDSSDTGRFGETYIKWKEVFDAKHLAVVDHHISNPGYGNTNIIDPNASSVCEILTIIIEDLEYHENVSADAATFLYTGLQTDSNMYFNTNTRSSTLRAWALLIDLWADFRLPIAELFKKRTKNQMRVWQYALANIQYHENNQVCCCALTREWLDNLDIPESEISGCFKWFISEILINIEWVKVAYLLYPLASWENKVSTRSQSGYNVAEICESFWGGWHKQAAGFESNTNGEVIEKELLEKIKDYL
jgi:phosphoesterase RecJ-like protein